MHVILNLCLAIQPSCCIAASFCTEVVQQRDGHQHMQGGREHHSFSVC